MVMYSSTLFVACFFTKDLYKAHFEAKWPQHHRGTRGKKRPLWFEKEEAGEEGPLEQRRGRRGRVGRLDGLVLRADK